MEATSALTSDFDGPDDDPGSEAVGSIPYPYGSVGGYALLDDLAPKVSPYVSGKGGRELELVGTGVGFSPTPGPGKEP